MFVCFFNSLFWYNEFTVVGQDSLHSIMSPIHLMSGELQAINEIWSVNRL